MDELLAKRLEELEKAREKNRAGNEKKIAKHHAMGRLTARERLDILLDEGSLLEMNPLSGHLAGQPGDGIICGSGTIEGRKVFVYSQDRTVQGGSIGIEHGIRMYNTIERALVTRVPLIGLHDSPGARMPKGEDLEDSGDKKYAGFGLAQEKHGGSVFYPNTHASGIIPQISGIMGSCAGISVYSPALHDFIFMLDKVGQMFITGPLMVKTSLGEDVTLEELGGAEIHAKKSGVCDNRYQDEKQLLLEIRRLLSFLPLNCDEKPPVVKTGDDPTRQCPELHDIVPTNPNKTFDVRKVIRVIVDNNDFFEVKPEFACEVIVGFGRLDGKTVGFVANNSEVMAGSITVDSSDKQARFIRFCDCFNIPIVILVDTPAYMPGTAQEHAGIIRHGAKVLYALCESTVPRISLVIRKAFGGGNLGMGVLAGLGTDVVLHWPFIESGILGARQAVMLHYGRQEGITKEELEKKYEEYRDTSGNPIYGISSSISIEDVISPAETRHYLIRSLSMLEGKKVYRPEKRHGNIPL